MSKGHGGTGHGRSGKGTSPSDDRQVMTVAEATIRSLNREANGGRMYIADFRDRTSFLSRGEQDHALKTLQQQGKIVMMRFDNPMERTARHDRAALEIAGAGTERHIFYVS